MKKTSAPQSIGEKAYLYLRGRILSGELPPGAALSEASIARELGNSRGPLREAVRRLTAEGFLRQAPNGGSVVVEFSRRDVAELYELREALEVYAAGKAAEHKIRDSELAAMKRAVDDVLLLRDELEASGETQLDAAGDASLHPHRPAVPHAPRARRGELAHSESRSRYARAAERLRAPPRRPQRRPTDPDSSLPPRHPGRHRRAAIRSRPCAWSASTSASAGKNA